MASHPFPANLDEFLLERLSDVPTAARLVIVLDPGGRLELQSQLTVERRQWQIVRYDGNDLAFRRQFRLEGQVIVWVTGTHLAKNSEPLQGAQMDLSSLTDVFRKADEVLDFSLIGVLTALVPNETWPHAPIERYAEILTTRLDMFLNGYTALRPHLGRGAALDAHSIRAMVLHCLQSSIAPQEFLFKQDTPARVLQQYVSLAWAADWDEEGKDLLRQQAREASKLPLGDLAAWFYVSSDSLAQFLYLYSFLSRAKLPNVVNQVRGLGILDFDPAALEKGTATVLAFWARDASWRSRVIRQAESSFQLDDIRRVTSLLDLSTPEKIAQTLTLAESPSLIYHLGAQLLESAYRTKRMSQALAAWSEYRPTALNTMDDDTSSARAARAMASILDEAAFISARTASSDLPGGLPGLLDWYTEGGCYDLEYAHARATAALNRVPDEDLRTVAQAFLDDLRTNLHEYLDRADRELARCITGNWHDYMTHPRLSTRVLWDFVKASRLKPTADACLWFIVFDGMRYDTWQKVVKPRLLQKFEVKKEKAYLCMLPSWTRIARTALIAGRTPDYWRGYNKTFTSNQAVLAANFFELTEKEQERKLRFYSGMESDRTARNLNRKKRYPFNVLIFNISDDDLHKQRGHLGTLNQSVETALEGILEFLDGLIFAEDTVIISSDHGFVELDQEHTILIKDDTRWERFMQGGENPVRYRYIAGVDRPAGLADEDAYSFEYRQMRDGKFTVPIGRKWFQRQGTSQADRYAHGGISLAEMVVPGAVLQLISEKKIALEFDDLPKEIQVAEGTEERISIWIRNKGNQPGEMELTLGTNTDSVPQVVRGTIAPNARCEASAAVKPVMQKGEPLTQSLRLSLKYATAAGRSKTIKREIPVKVQKRKDVVEISFGGLDDLDR